MKNAGGVSMWILPVPRGTHGKRGTVARNLGNSLTCI